MIFGNYVLATCINADGVFPVQINALREEDLNENFFKALSRVQEIHANCKVLLRTHHQVISCVVISVIMIAHFTTA